MAKKEKPDSKPEKEATIDAFLTSTLGKQIDKILAHYNDEQKIELSEHFIETFKEVKAYFKN